MTNGQARPIKTELLYTFDGERRYALGHGG